MEQCKRIKLLHKLVEQNSCVMTAAEINCVRAAQEIIRCRRAAQEIIRCRRVAQEIISCMRTSRKNIPARQLYKTK